MRKNGSYEVAVVGGGPAGAATAMTLTSLGRSVCVFERTTYDNFRVGETLPPESRVSLGRLGLWEPFEAQKYTSSPGIISIWGKSEPYCNDFIGNPYGSGWHVNRCRFDRFLADAAEERGAALYLGSSVRSCVRDGLGGWLVEADSPHGKRKVQARFLVNATGRSTLPQGGQVPPRRASDKLIALVSVAPALTPESRTLIEACENGWWYAAAVPGSSMVLAYLTDADLLPRGSAAAEWERQLVQTSQIRLLIAPAAGFTWIRRVAANSYIRHPVVGRDHVAVGDAATAFDPLSGRGILNALESGRAAALAIESALSGDFAGLDAFAHQVEQGFQIHEESRGHYYSREHRWPDSVFWRRRRPAAMGGTA